MSAGAAVRTAATRSGHAASRSDRARPAAKPAPARPPLGLVTSPVRRRGLPFGVVLATVLGAGLVTLLLLHTWAGDDGFAVSKLQTQSTRLQSQLEQLQTSVQYLQSPERLRRLAVEHGMVPAVGDGFVNERTGKIVGHSPPAPAAVVNLPAASTTTTTNTTSTPTTTTTTTTKTKTAATDPTKRAIRSKKLSSKKNHLGPAKKRPAGRHH